MAVVDIVLLLIIVISVACLQLPRILWSSIIGLVLLLITIFGAVSFITLSICWLLFLAVILFVYLTQFRQRYITKPFIHFLQKRMPSISSTEREAIEAGDVWWEKDLFCGRPAWKKLLAFPTPTLTEEEKAFLNNEVETVCEMINDWKIVNEEYNLPNEVWDYLKKEKFFGLIILKEFEGRGFSALAHSTIVMKIATRSLSAAVNMMVPNSLGPAELILHYGTPEQKKYYLPRLAKGEEIPCFALTAPEAGSDAGAITDKGIVCYGQYEGKETLGIRLTWDKRYITLAPIATLLGLAFRLYDPEHLLGPVEEIGITLCLISTILPGVEIGHRHLPLRMAFLNGPTRGKDVFVPLTAIIGGPSMAGQGWKMLMECLSVGRGISLPALSTACGKLTYRLAGAYARLRKQFHVSLSNFEGIEEALSQIAGSTYLLEASRLMTAGAIDLKIKPAIATAIAKYNMTEMARTVISHAMDIHAGHGIQMGPRNILAHAHMGIPVSITVEGANILTRNLIIFGQGAIRCHPYILQEVELFNVKDTPQKINQLDKLLLSHLGYMTRNLARNLFYGLTGGKLIVTFVRGPVASYCRQLTRMSTALALLSDVCVLILGGNLKRKERISARLGDMLSHLYLASAVIKYFHDQGKPTTDIVYIKWCLEKCLFEIQTACDELLHNFPLPFLGKIFRALIFPYGTAYRRPKDKLSHEIVKFMLEPSDFRDRLTQYFYAKKSVDDPIGRMESALKMSLQIEPMEKKIQNALRNGILSSKETFTERLQTAKKIGILSETEIRMLQEFDALTKEVIKVDEFSFDLNTVLT